MKAKIIALGLALLMLAGCTAPAANNGGAADASPTTPPATTPPVTSDPAQAPTIGFVVIGLGGEFFQTLADTYVETFTGLGWKASYVDGKFDPAVQIEAVENYVASDVDVLVLWSISGAALSSAVKQAQDAGVKVVSFVEKTETYDVCMLNDDAMIAGNCAKLAARWVEEHFADAAAGSVQTAVITYTAAENNTIQSNTLLDVSKYSDKINVAVTYEVTGEGTADGLTAAENIYLQNPDIDLFLTAQSGVALGINNYFTSLSSPVTDYADMGIFCINGSTEIYEAIAASVDNKSPLRGTVMTGSVQDTVDELVEYSTGIYDGSIESGSTFYAANILLFSETIEEYLATGAVTSFSVEDMG